MLYCKQPSIQFFAYGLVAVQTVRGRSEKLQISAVIITDSLSSIRATEQTLISHKNVALG